MAARVSGRPRRRPGTQAEMAAELPAPTEARREEVAKTWGQGIGATRYNAERHNREVAAARDDAIRVMAKMEEGAYHLASRPGDPEGAALIRGAERQLNTVLQRLDALEHSAQQARIRRERPVCLAIRDADGHDLRPDPLTARSATELVNALRRYRIWAGEPSFREMATNSRQRAATSTMCAALLDEEALPTLEVIEAVVLGCGGGEKDLQAFTTAWRRIRFKKEDAGARAGLRVLPNPSQIG